MMATLSGRRGNDILIGGVGNDTITGRAGDDFLDGGAGADILDGGTGNDRIVYDPADNPAQVTGGSGTDTLVVIDMAAPTGYHLAAGSFEVAEVTHHDLDHSQSWSSIVETYNAGWQLTQAAVTGDDGGRMIIALDPANANATSQVWSSFDPQQRLSYVDQFFDNGTRTFIDVDETNSASWSQASFVYDAQGRLDTHDVVYDDGSHVSYNYDQAGTEPFQLTAFLYDSSGRPYQEVIQWDDGSTTYNEVNPYPVVGGAGNDALTGTAADDTISGGWGDDTLFGLGGNDRLVGGLGNDIVHGGDGNDLLEAYTDTGNDILYGDAGADVFHFDTWASTHAGGDPLSTSPTIMDFASGVDRIDLRLIAIQTNDHNLYWLGAGEFTGANRLEARFTGGQLQIDYDGDRVADLLVGVATLAPSDITYIFDPWGY